MGAMSLPPGNSFLVIDRDSWGGYVGDIWEHMWRHGFSVGMIGRDWPQLLLGLDGLGIIPTPLEGRALCSEG